MVSASVAPAPLSEAPVPVPHFIEDSKRSSLSHTQLSLGFGALFVVAAAVLALRLTSHPVARVLAVIVAGFAALCVYEQRRVLSVAKDLPGPKWFAPFVTGVVHMVSDPTDFWHVAFSRGPLSWLALGPKIVFVVSDAAGASSIFARVSERMPLALSLNSKPLLGDDNFAYLNGSEHKFLRSKLLPLFSQRSLNMYLTYQVASNVEGLAQWAEAGKDFSMREQSCILNAATSQRAFLGEHITDAEAKELAKDYQLLTGGMFTLPINMPGSALHEGVAARHRILAMLEKVVQRAKAKIADMPASPASPSADDAAPSCLLDQWMRSISSIVVSSDPADEASVHMARHFTDYGAAKIMLDFLFAAQDASTSSLTFTAHYLALHPELKQKARDECARLHQAQIEAARAAGETPPATLRMDPDTVANLKYCHAFIREVLRIAPPATLVPHMTLEPMEVSVKAAPAKCPFGGDAAVVAATTTTPATAATCPMQKFRIPAGAIVAPSVYAANREGWVNPESFDPSRFYGPEADASGANGPHGSLPNFLTFGTGPHACMGYKYAQQQLVTFLALIAYEYEYERPNTPDMHKLTYAPTIYPRDGCPIQNFKRRTHDIKA